MFELVGLLLTVFVLFIFGLSALSLMIITGFMILSFILLGTISLICKFAFWLILGFVIYYFVFKKKEVK